MLWTFFIPIAILFKNNMDSEVILMALTDAQLRASKKYHGKLDDIKMRVPKGEREVLQNHAQSRGESLNAFLYRAANETMARDKENELPSI